MPTDPIYLFGATSIVGWNVYRVSQKKVVPFCNHNTKVGPCKTWRRLNLENWEEIRNVFSNDSPHTLIHCGGICDIEKCQRAPEWAYSINVESISALIDHLPKQTRFIYCSSDHVFGRDGIYTERSDPCPISVYGRSKTEAEKIIKTKRPDSLIIRFGLPIGPSIDKRSGHLDWLIYRCKQGLPITIIRGESRSAIWAEELSLRILELTRSTLTGIRHIQSSRIVSRVELAEFLMKKFQINPPYQVKERCHLNHPHLGSIELQTDYNDALSCPLPSVLDRREKVM